MAKELKAELIIAEKWRGMDNEAIIESLDIALHVLKDRQLTEGEKKQLLAVMDDVLGILMGEGGV